MIRRSIVMAALIVGAVLIVAPGAFSADRAEALFQDGVRAYEAGNYTGAGELFEEAAASGVVNGKLYYNAGNAWFKAGELGRAVLWYKRAERLMPADPDLAYNLGRAEAQVRDSRDAPGYAKMALGRWMGFWPPGLAAWLAVGFNLLFWGLLAARRTGAPAFLGREAGAWVRGVRSAALACAVVFTLTAGWWHCRDLCFTRGVVLAETVTARSGLGELATKLFTLHGGTVVDIERERDGHVLIRSGPDRVGWTSQEDVGRI